MMKDPLKEFVDQNRAAFDDKEPSDRVWRNIKSALVGVWIPTNRLWDAVGLWRAAAILFMVTTGFLLVSRLTGAVPSDQAAVSAKDFSEFKDVEAFYTRQIYEKVELIDGFKKTDGLNGFTQDFQQLEAMYMVLKEEMKASPSEKVKDALVLNLLIRIDLLNQRLHNLETEYKRENKTTEDAV